MSFHSAQKGGAAVALGCMVLVCAGAAKAQGGKLDEVVVTAQKVEENLQQVPIAITAITAEDLQNKGINNFAEVARSSPSISFAPYPGSGNTLILYMRGQGAAVPNAPSSEGGVGIYQDGFYIGRPSGMTFDLADLERVEVLRGPQGTLYGRNTTGGAVNLVSRAPSGEFGLRQSFDFGTRNLFRSLTTVDLPRWGDVSTKLSLLKSRIDGYVKNSGSGADFGEQSQQGGRVQLRWDIRAGLSADYFFEKGDIDDTPLYYQNASLAGETILGYPYTKANVPRDRSYRPVDLPVSVTHSEAHGLTLGWDINDALTLKSLTGYRKLDSQGYSDYMETITPMAGVPFQNNGSGLTHQHQFSQELQLLGRPSGALRYVAGLYYFDESVSYETITRFPDIFLSLHQISRTHSRSAAAFGQLTWTPPIADDRMELTFGARYTRDRRASSRFIDANGFVIENGAADGASANLDFHRFDPSFTADFHWTDTLSTYAKVATGYRAGGTYEGAPAGQFTLGGYGPEKVTSYELGLKSDWFDRRLRVNIAAFDARYRDLQMYVPVDPNDVTRALYYNIGRATVRGAELDITAAPTDELTFNINYSHLDAVLSRVDVVPGSIYDGSANPLSPFRVGDNIERLFVMPYAPADSAALGADYTAWRFDNGNLALHVDYRWESKTYSGAAGGPDVPGRRFDVRPAYGVVNGRLMLNLDLPRGDRAKISLWGKNIFNKRYKQQVIANGSAGVAVESPTTHLVTPAGYHDQAVAWAEPAAFGMQLQYEY